MAKRDYIADIERALKGKKRPTELLSVILGFLNFKKVEIKTYNLLLKTSLTIKQIEKKMNLSERTIRKYIKRLEYEGLVTKTAQQGKRLRYLYKAVPIREAWKKIKGKVQDILNEITSVLETSTILL